MFKSLLFCLILLTTTSLSKNIHTEIFTDKNSIAKGSSADYFYWKSKTKSFAAELGNQKIPDYSRILLSMIPVK